MAFCKHCGSKLPDEAMFCAFCGNPVVPLPHTCDLPVSKKYSYLGKLGNSQIWFFVTVGLFILNFIMSFLNTVEVSLIFVSEEGTLIELCELASEFGVSDGIEYVTPLIVLSIILIALSIISTIFPIFLKGTYDKRFLIPNYISSILVLGIYGTATIIFGTDQYDFVSLTAMGYLYIVESLAALICTILFSIKLTSASNSSVNVIS